MFPHVWLQSYGVWSAALIAAQQLACTAAQAMSRKWHKTLTALIHYK
jgi:hypothetical protein